jgi:hypothetical protein
MFTTALLAILVPIKGEQDALGGPLEKSDLVIFYIVHMYVASDIEVGSSVPLVPSVFIR